jgi:uncharacterized protein YjbI with pentapeptide repeats
MGISLLSEIKKIPKKILFLGALLSFQACNGNQLSITDGNASSRKCGSYSQSPKNYNEIMDRIRAMRTKEKCRGRINLQNADLSLVWGDEAMKRRIFVQFLGYSSADDFAQHYGPGYADYDDMMTTLGYSNMNQFDYGERWLDPYMPAHLSWEDVDVTGAIFPQDISFQAWSDTVDFSSTIGLTVDTLNIANTEWSSIKLPAMDLTGLTVTKLYGFDFTNTTGLTVLMLNAASDLRNMILPPGMDLTGLSQNNIASTDLTDTTGLDLAFISTIWPFSGKYPNGLDMTGFACPWNCSGRDFTNVSNLTLAMIDGAANFNGIKFPVMDFTGLTVVNRTFSGADLSKVTGLTDVMINTLAWDAFTNGTILPAMDVSTLNFGWLYIYGSDFTYTTGLNVGQLYPGIDLHNTVLPAMDLTGLVVNGWNDFSGTDLTKVTGFTVAMLNAAGSVSGVKLPLGMNVTGLTRTDLYRTDYSNTIGLTVPMLNASRFLPSKLPVMDVTGLTILELRETDLSNVTGFSIAMLNAATDTNSLKLPVMDVTGLTLTNLSTIDFSNTTGLTMGMLVNATNIDYMTLPPMKYDFKNFNYVTGGNINTASKFGAIAFKEEDTVIGFDFR